MTTAIWASRRRPEIASAIARKLEPRPEIRIPRRRPCGLMNAGSFVHGSFIHNAAPAHHLADLVPALAQALEHFDGSGKITLRNHHNHPDAEIERPPPVVFR